MVKNRLLISVRLLVLIQSTFLGLNSGLIQEAFASLPTTAATTALIKNELLNRGPSSSFENLIVLWERTYGTDAVPSLIGLASDKKLSDTDRFIAFMSAIKIGGKAAAPLVTPFLKDTSWMIRSAALRALRTIADPEKDQNIAQLVLPLLQDPALVVRSEAIDTVLKLKPSGSEDALVQAIYHPSNYRPARCKLELKGKRPCKADWIPARALEALVELKARSAVPRLKLLLSYDRDPALKAHAIKTLEQLTGRTLQSQLRVGASLNERAKAWEKVLSE